jgi:hypothetical protein
MCIYRLIKFLHIDEFTGLWHRDSASNGRNSRLLRGKPRPARWVPAA